MSYTFDLLSKIKKEGNLGMIELGNDFMRNLIENDLIEALTKMLVLATGSEPI